MGRIRVGIIGANAHRGWGSMVHIPALRALPDYTLSALCTSRQQTADEAAKKFEVPLAFADPHKLAAHPDVDLVVVCVKIPTHPELVAAALTAGKSVLCEWSLGPTLSQAEAVHMQAERSGVRHFIGLQARVAPAVNCLKDLLAEGAVGQVVSCTLICSAAGGARTEEAYAYVLDRRNGANALSIVGGHAMDLLCYVLGEFQGLVALLATQFSRVTIAETGQTVTATSPDQVLVCGTLKSGVAASIHLQTGTPGAPRFRLEVHGTEGSLVLAAPDGMAPQMSALTLQMAKGRGAQLEPVSIPDRYRWVPGPAPKGPIFNVAQLYAKIGADLRAGTHEAPDFSIALTRHRMLDAIERAAQTGSPQGYVS